MGLQIEDGTGTGQLAKVVNNKLCVCSKTAPRIFFVSRDDADSYSWTAVTENLPANGTALLVANDSTTKFLYIYSIYVWSDVATAIHIHVPSYVTPAGTATVGVNLNRTSGKLAEATAKANETANVFAQANVLYTLHTNESATDQFAVYMEFNGSLILGYHNSVAVDIVEDSAAFNCTIVGFFETSPP